MKQLDKSNKNGYPTKESIMKEARDAGRRFGTEPMSTILKTNINDLGYYQDDRSKSGFQYLQDVLNSSFTEGLPGPMAPYSPTIEALTVAEFSNWNNNCDIIQAVKESIRFLES